MNKEEQAKTYDKFKKDIAHILVSRMNIKIGAKEEEIEIAEIRLEGYKECIEDMTQILKSLKVLEGEEDEI